MMTTLTQSETLLKELGKMPLFRLSLGSKELFHSNFLEFLWENNHCCFLKMINELIGKEFLKTEGVDYVLSREKENFDICIYRKDGNSIIYELILENKVKSIPYKEQLDKYSNRIRKKNDNTKKEHLKSFPKYLLLSLASDFPDKDNLYPWKVVHYDALEKAIEHQPWSKDKPGYSFIGEYRRFILLLNELSGAILDNLHAEELFHDVKSFKVERLHDLYIKLRCTSFMLEIKERLNNHIHVEVLAADQVRRQKAGVYLNVNVFNSVGQVGALIWTGKKKSDIYEIIIQGDQYRHGINQYTTVPKKPKQRNRLNLMWSRLAKAEPSKSFLHRIGEETKLTPQVADTKKKKIGPYNDYDNGYVYRYINCKDWKVPVLLENMVKDIIDIATELEIPVKP